MDEKVIYVYVYNIRISVQKKEKKTMHIGTYLLKPSLLIRATQNIRNEYNKSILFPDEFHIFKTITM